MIKPLVQLLQPSEFYSTRVALRVRSNEVTSFDDSLKDLVRDLIDTLKAHDIAIGLAAPQIGVGLRVAAVNLNSGKTEPTFVFANPREVVANGKKDKKKESCMSIPHFRGDVERREKIEFIYEDQNGKTQQMRAMGFMARALFHEIDHLDGVLYIDRMRDPRQLEPVTFFKEDVPKNTI